MRRNREPPLMAECSLSFATGGLPRPRLPLRGTPMSELTLAEKLLPLSAVQAHSRGMWGDQLLDALPIGIYMCDREGLLIRYNLRAAELWGRAPVPADEQHRYCGAFRAYGSDGQPIAIDEMAMVEVLRS